MLKRFLRWLDRILPKHKSTRARRDRPTPEHVNARCEITHTHYTGTTPALTQEQLQEARAALREIAPRIQEDLERQIIEGVFTQRRVPPLDTEVMSPPVVYDEYWHRYGRYNGSVYWGGIDTPTPD